MIDNSNKQATSLRTWTSCNDALSYWEQDALALSIGYEVIGKHALPDLSLLLMECKTQRQVLRIDQINQRWPINPIRDDLLPLLLQNRPIIHGQSGAPEYLGRMLRGSGIDASTIPEKMIRMLCHDIRPLWDRCEGIAPRWDDGEKRMNPPLLDPFDFGPIEAALDRCGTLQLMAAMRGPKEIAVPRIYISGPISDNVDYVKEFNVAERHLRSLGYDPVNPVKLARHLDPHLPPAVFWSRAMEIDIKALCTCDEIMLLPLKGIQSKGVAIELQLAKEYGINVQPAHQYREKVEDRFSQLGFTLIQTKDRQQDVTRGR